jgi:hypothetical protein
MLSIIKETWQAVLYGGSVESQSSGPSRPKDTDHLLPKGPANRTETQTDTIAPRPTRATLRHRRIPSAPPNPIITLPKQLDTACRASQRLDPDSALKWQALHKRCMVEGVDFSTLLDTEGVGGVRAIEIVMDSHDWTSVRALHALLLDGQYAEGRINRGNHFLSTYSLNKVLEGPSFHYGKNGSYYEGDHIDGKLYGRAHIRDGRGYTYDGDIQGIEMEGQAKVFWPTGFRYEGQVFRSFRIWNTYYPFGKENC